MRQSKGKPYILSGLSNDIPASLVVFLVALPLCLGIAVASGAPPFSGFIAGIIGGIVVGMVSGSHVSVSGPAAGLTVIVLGGIERLGSLEIFLGAVVVAGVIQLLLGLIRAGSVAYFFPHSVIKGMLAAIGMIFILKQLPHAMGYDSDYEGDESFVQPDKENTLTELWNAVNHINTGALIIALVAMGILLIWGLPVFRRNRILSVIPAPLLAVLSGIGVNAIFGAWYPEWQLGNSHLVSLPVATSSSEFFGFFMFPDFSEIGSSAFWITAVTIAIIASVESLLSLDAADKLDPHKRVSPMNRELIAQGAGNTLSGLIGGIPVTAVIVRTSANISAGAKTKMSAIIHGMLLLICVALIPGILNMIPLAALAAVLLQVGYKLARPKLVAAIYKQGWDQFIPFIVTALAILFTDLLVGIGIGMAIGLLFVIKTNFRQAITVVQDENRYMIKFNKDVTFLNKPKLRKTLSSIPENSYVIIDASKIYFVDHDIEETIEDFAEKAKHNNITVEVKSYKNK